MPARVPAKAITLAAFAALAAGCAAAPAARTAGAPKPLTGTQVCQQLRADILRNGGTPDVPALQALLRKAPAKFVSDLDAAAVDARHGKDLLVGFDLGKLGADCSGTGVRIPAGQ